VQRVVHVVRRFAKDKWGGTETVILNTSEQLIENDIHSEIYSTDMFEPSGVEIIQNTPVFRFPYVFPYFNLNKDARYKLKLKGGNAWSWKMLIKLLFAKNLFVIHTHALNRIGGIARLVAKIKRVPYVVSIHGGYLTLPSSTANEMSSPLENTFDWGKLLGFIVGSRKIVQDADAIICVGKIEHDLLKKKYPNKKVIYFPNGVKVDDFQKVSADIFLKKYNLPKDQKIVTCISRIELQKNQLLLVNAFARFSKENPEYKLLLIGTEDTAGYTNKIKARIEELGLANKLIMINGLPAGGNLLLSAFKASTFFVLPSIHEPFGIVILEAWASGIPVIASKVGGIPGFTEDNVNILHFESENEDILLEKMNLLNGNEELQKKLTTNASTSVQRYDWSKITKDLIDLYNSL
jgi:glycosyltransferase involved in cell wall biosynthesis